MKAAVTVHDVAFVEVVFGLYAIPVKTYVVAAALSLTPPDEFPKLIVAVVVVNGFPKLWAVFASVVVVAIVIYASVAVAAANYEMIAVAILVEAVAVAISVVVAATMVVALVDDEFLQLAVAVDGFLSYQVSTAAAIENQGCPVQFPGP